MWKTFFRTSSNKEGWACHFSLLFFRILLRFQLHVRLLRRRRRSQSHWVEGLCSPYETRTSGFCFTSLLNRTNWNLFSADCDWFSLHQTVSFQVSSLHWINFALCVFFRCSSRQLLSAPNGVSPLCACDGFPLLFFSQTVQHWFSFDRKQDLQVFSSRAENKLSSSEELHVYLYTFFSTLFFISPFQVVPL